MNRIVLIAAIGVLPLLSNAQDAPSPRSAGAEFYFESGWDFINFSNLNNALAAAQIKQVTPAVYHLGVGLSVRFSQLIFGTDLGFMTGAQANEVTGSTIHFYFSTNELRTRTCIFSPEVGVALQDVQVLVPGTSTASTFSEALHSGNETQVDNFNTTLNVGMAFKIRQGLHDIPVFRMGYRYGLSNPQWELRDAAVSGAPRDRLSSFFVELTVGFGS